MKGVDSIPSPVCNRNLLSNVKEPQIATSPNASTIHLQAGVCSAERGSLECNQYLQSSHSVLGGLFWHMAH